MQKATDNSDKNKSMQVSPEEEARLKAERNAKANLHKAQSKINKILEEHNVNLQVDKRSPYGNPAIVLVPLPAKQ